eukprot:13704202-Ditylum_brightwellii.AAC.1
MVTFLWQFDGTSSGAASSGGQQCAYSNFSHFVIWRQILYLLMNISMEVVGKLTSGQHDGIDWHIGQ